jgi:hypothetical protein
MRNIEEILITQPSLARDTHELRHDARFRLFIWRYEVNPFCGPFGFHSSIDETNAGNDLLDQFEALPLAPMLLGFQTELEKPSSGSRFVNCNLLFAQFASDASKSGFDGVGGP